VQKGLFLNTELNEVQGMGLPAEGVAVSSNLSDFVTSPGGRGEK